MIAVKALEEGKYVELYNLDDFRILISNNIAIATSQRVITNEHGLRWHLYIDKDSFKNDTLNKLHLSEFTGMSISMIDEKISKKEIGFDDTNKWYISYYGFYDYINNGWCERNFNPDGSPIKSIRDIAKEINKEVYGIE